MPPPQEQVDQSFIADRISRAEVRLFPRLLPSFIASQRKWAALARLVLWSPPTTQGALQLAGHIHPNHTLAIHIRTSHLEQLEVKYLAAGYTDMWTGSNR